MKKVKLKYEQLSGLKSHEKLDLFVFLKNLLITVMKRRIELPILVEKKYGIILDGHHRYSLAKIFRLDLPALVVSLSEVNLKSRRKSVKVSKALIKERALNGFLFPPKTTRFALKFKTKEQ